MRCWLAALALALAALPATASAREASCMAWIDANPQEPYHPLDANDDSEDVFAWWEPRNDDPVTFIQGSRYSSPAELAARIAASDDTVFVINGGDFSGWDFRGIATSLTGLCFRRSNLAGSLWDAADVSRGAFIESDLSGASLRGASLRQVLFDNARLAGTVMDGADLAGGRLSGGWFDDLVGMDNADISRRGLDGWSLVGATLEAFEFRCGIEIHNGCPLDRAIDFTRADLTKADLGTFRGWGAFNVTGARLQDTRLAPDQLVYFGTARLAGGLLLAGRTRDLALSREEAATLMAAVPADTEMQAGPSFDCHRAATSGERMVCSEEGDQHGLRQLDMRLSAVFAGARPSHPRLVADQRDWLRLRDACPSYECLEHAYQRRITWLLPLAGVPRWLARGQSALFVEDALAIPEERLGTPLADRLRPLLADAAWQLLVVRREADDTLSITGVAIGANAHVCTISASHLVMDPASGWFSSDYHPDRLAPAFRLYGEELEVFADGHPDMEVYPFNDFVSCGARASFGPARLLTADPVLIEGIRAAWEP